MDTEAENARDVLRAERREREREREGRRARRAGARWEAEKGEGGSGAEGRAETSAMSEAGRGAELARARGSLPDIAFSLPRRDPPPPGRRDETTSALSSEEPAKIRFVVVHMVSFGVCNNEKTIIIGGRWTARGARARRRSASRRGVSREGRLASDSEVACSGTCASNVI